MKSLHDTRKHKHNLGTVRARVLPSVLLLLLLGLAPDTPAPAQEPGRIEVSLERWLAPQDWRRDRDQPALSLGAKGDFDDQHIFAPHVIHQDGVYWMYYSGSQRCVDAG